MYASILILPTAQNLRRVSSAHPQTLPIYVAVCGSEPSYGLGPNGLGAAPSAGAHAPQCRVGARISSGDPSKASGSLLCT